MQERKPSERVSLPTESLILHPRYQLRGGTDPETVIRYTDLLENGTELPAIRVWRVDGKLYVTDGFHRVAAYAALHREIWCDIFEGDARAAFFDACIANGDHGKPRDEPTLDRQIEGILLDPEWSAMSDRALGRELHCSYARVRRMRKILDERTRPADAPAQPRTATGADGRTRRTPYQAPRDPYTGRPDPAHDVPRRPMQPNRSPGEERNPRTAELAPTPGFSGMEAEFSQILARIPGAAEALAAAEAEPPLVIDRGDESAMFRHGQQAAWNDAHPFEALRVFKFAKRNTVVVVFVDPDPDLTLAEGQEIGDELVGRGAAPGGVIVHKVNRKVQP